MTTPIPDVDLLVSFTVSDESPSSRVEPLTLDDVKLALRLGDSTSEDALLRDYIASARAVFEELTGRQIINAVWEYALDGTPWDSFIELPKPPLISVDSIEYDDASGTATTFDRGSYRVLPSAVLEGSPPTGVLDPYCPCGVVQLASGTSWPTTSGLMRSLRIRRTCGYGDSPTDVPAEIRSILRLIVGHSYRNRAEVTAETLHQVPMGAEARMKAFKYRALRTRKPVAV